MRITMTVLRCLGFSLVLAVMSGCAKTEPAATEELDPVAAESAKAAPEETPSPTNALKTGDAALRRASRLANRVDRSAKGAKQAADPTRSAQRRTPPPAGMDAFADFDGKRIGLVHTANLIGEIDPCG